MARSARKQLADMRAMEEEDMRMTMHGSGKHFIGAGATPSMGLSQFRGGAKKVRYEEEEEEETEEEMEGGNIISKIVGRLLPRVVRAPSTAIVPFVPRVLPRVAKPPSTAIIPLGPFGRPVANILNPRTTLRYFVKRPTSSIFAKGSKAAVARAAKRFGPAAARAAALGTTLGALGSFLGDQAGADSGDAGYFDDYAGEEYPVPFEGVGEADTFVPQTTGRFAPEQIPLYPAEGELPEDLTPDELAWYLQSGNLPARYAAAPSKRQRGRGKLTIHHGGRVAPAVERRRESQKHPKPAIRKIREGEIERDRSVIRTMPEEEIIRMLRGRRLKNVPPKKPRSKIERQIRPTTLEGSGKKSGRAAVVKQVMKERGCSLPQASRIVKEEGLY